MAFQGCWKLTPCPLGARMCSTIAVVSSVPVGSLPPVDHDQDPYPSPVRIRIGIPPWYGSWFASWAIRIMISNSGWYEYVSRLRSWLIMIRLNSSVIRIRTSHDWPIWIRNCEWESSKFVSVFTSVFHKILLTFNPATAVLKVLHYGSQGGKD